MNDKKPRSKCFDKILHLPLPKDSQGSGLCVKFPKHSIPALTGRGRAFGPRYRRGTERQQQREQAGCGFFDGEFHLMESSCLFGCIV